MLLDRALSFLLVVDMQERLVPAVLDGERVVANALRLVAAARRLGVPVRMTEHCPEKIGPLVPALSAQAGPDTVLKKVHFAVADEPACAARLAELVRPQCVLAGTEAHVCVMQSALSLQRTGYKPYVVADAVSSRSRRDRDMALQRLRGAGIEAVTTEMVLFEWLRRGDTAEFRDLLPLIKG